MEKKSILLLRHGEAEFAFTAPDDHARRLTPRGQEQIEFVSTRLQSMGYKAQMVYYSDSKRTAETFAGLDPDIYKGAKVRCEPGLYLATETALFDFLFQTEDSIASVLVVGHNPGLSELASFLSEKVIHLGVGEGVFFQGDLVSWADAGHPGKWQGVRHIHRKAK